MHGQKNINTINYKLFFFTVQFVYMLLLYCFLYFILLRKRLHLGHSGREVVCCDNTVVGWKYKKKLLGKRESNCSTYYECVRILTTHRHWF